TCDPLGHDVADAAAREDSKRVEAGGDEESLQVRGLNHQVVVIRGEGLGAAEQQLDARLLENRDTATGALQMRLHALPVGRYLAEGKIRGDTGRVPWPGGV